MPGRSMPSGLTRGSESLASRHFADSALDRSRGRLCSARTKLRRFVCRLDVCWTAFFFLFLLCVAAITSVVTQTIIDRHTLATWLTLHQLRISAANSRIEQGTAIVDRMAAAFNDVHLLKPLPMQTEVALELACSTLAAYDKDMVVRAFLAISVGQEEMVGCMHGMADSGSLSTLTGFLSQNHTMDGTYLVDKDTMKFARPLRQMTVAPPDRRSASDMVTYSFETTRIFELGEAYYNGSIATYDKRECWFYPTATPHLIYYTLPVSIAARNLVLNRNLDDYVQVRIDGSRILLGNAFKRTTGLSIAAFIPQTLDNADPSVLATSWGQESVSNNSMFQSTDYSGVQYLKVSGIDDPLMRAALKHIRLTSLQRNDCNETVIFHFKGACATVTALTLTTNTGFVIRLVFASAHEPLVGPYRTIVNALNGVLGFMILLFTFLFWCFIYTQFTRPLTELAVLMTRNVATGKRTMYVAASTTWMRLKEVDQLIRAHNRAMRRLRQIELFIPAAIRNYFNRPAAQTRYLLTDISDQISSETEMHTIPLCTLTTQVQTAVYIMLRPAPRPYVPPESLTRLLRSKTTSSVGGMSPNTLAPTTIATTAAVAHSAVSAVSAAVSSGPFSSPAALELFAEAIYELSAQHHGLVYRICPDSCVIHFGKTARTLQSDVGNRAAWREGRKEAVDAQHQQQDIESGIRRDARDAMAFVWRLQDFMNDTQNGVGDVDACTLIDTTTFVCGQYRAKASEHVLSIAMGRDVQRDLGPLLPALKVRVAMTEETARRLRAEWAGTLEPGVRQLPIEAVSTDRAGSNKSVVLLYEALPGSVAGDLVWQRYSQYCFEGFACMLRGDYAAALQAYTRICEISDLEPGLMPVCLEREAAISFVSRGATSVQVDRLMRECRRCVSLHIVRPYCRTRRLPPGMRATLISRGDEGSAAAEWGARGSSRPASSRPSSVATQPQQSLQRLTPPLTVADGTPSPALTPPPPPPKPPARRVHFAPRLLMSCEDRQRYLVSSSDAGVVARHVLGDPTKVIRDVFGQKWSLARNFRTATAAHPSNVYVVSLHASGAFCLASQLILRQVPPIVAKAVKNAPDGPLTDALRSAIPVCDPNATQMAQLRAVVNTFCTLSHPSLLLPFSYCTGVEGVVVLLWPFFPGCSLRELLRRHSRLTHVSAAHCTLPILAALSHLHAQKAVHGEVSLDTVVVTSTGECRLLTRCAGNRNAREVFALPQTCYVSPAMAAGALPTPACDVFCYGLMCIEILSGGKVWKWASGAAAAEGQAALSADELATLLKTGGQPFMDAVAMGLLQPDMDVLDAVPTGNLYRELAAATVRACLSPDPARRPTAKQVCAVTKLFVEKDITNESETTPP